MKHLPLLCLLLGLTTAMPGATLTVSNLSTGGNGFHGVANQAGQLLAPGQARGVIGRMTLDDTAIEQHVAAGNLAALDTAFQALGGDFAIALSDAGPDGAFEKSVTGDTRASANSLGGSPVFLWIYLGTNRVTANQYLLVKLKASLPTDAEEAPPAFASLAVRPDTIDVLYSGSVNGTHDYGLGSGALATLRLESPGGTPNNPPVAQNLDVQVLAGVPFNGQVAATDADLQPLEFLKVSDPGKGELIFNADGSFTYTAGAEQTGQDSFTFKASDGIADSANASVSIQIQTGGLLAQTLTFTLPSQVDSDAPPLALTATASSGLPVSFQLLSGPATLEGSTLTLSGSTGTLLVRALQNGNDQYAAVSAERVIHVVPAEGAFAIGSLNQSYRGIPLNVSIVGAPLNEVTVTYNDSANPPVNAGTYTVVASRGATRKTAKLVIAKAPLRVTAASQRRMIGQPNPELDFAYSGFVGEDRAENVFQSPATKTAAAPVASTTAKDTSPAGTYPIRLSGGAAANYLFQFVSANLTVEGFEGRHEILLTAANSAHITAKVELIPGKTPKNGSLPFTGRLWTPTELQPLPLKGDLTLDAEGEQARTTLAFSRGANSYALRLELDLDGDLSAELDLNGSLHSAGSDGRRLQVFGKNNPPPSLGAHTLVVAPGARFAGGDRELPAGAGHATGVISPSGQLTLAGRLADGMALTATLLPDAGGRYRLFATPYKRLQSWVAANMTVSEHPDLPGLGHIPDSAGEVMFWVKTASDKDQTHRAGLDLLACNLRLTPWRKPAKATRNSEEITLLGELGLVEGNTVGVAHSDLPGLAAAGLPGSVRLAASGKFIVLDPAGNPSGWQISLNTANGTFQGKFTLRDGKTRTVNFTGVLQRPHSTEPYALLGRGHFLLPPAPEAGTTELRSGEIQFGLD
jgi:VCBS repeat-containing protein